MTDTQNNNYAIIRVGGQQMMVRPGDKVKVNAKPGNVGDVVKFEEVLLIANNGKTEIGAPLLSGRSVSAKVLALVKEAKVVAFKKKRRKGFTWKKGHRQQKTSVLIEAIA
jgi:large subunit ribosomal protein L21